MRQKIAAGNWKMFKTFDEATAMVRELAGMEIPDDVRCIIAPPYLYLNKFVGLTEKEGRIHIAAQNCHEADEGAYTGEISAPMLSSIRVPYVIIGHSERREQHHESNDMLKQKVLAAFKHGLTPIFCCGESLDVRKKGTHIQFVTDQLSESLGSLSSEQAEGLIIAYEPIWAIGTGETASPAQAQEMHQAIRYHLAQLFSPQIAQKIPVLYGGSVKPGNAKELFAKPDVDGGLVGGASLDAASFHAIIQSF